MKTLVTGGTGLVGNALARLLLARGHAVRALARNPGAARAMLPAEIDCAQGDVTDPPSLRAAMKDVGWVFHAAGMPEQWQADDSIFDRVNHLGTVNVLEAAQAARVRRVIYTSTMDVFAAPRGGTLVETRLDEEPKPSPYERSKVAGDRAAQAYVERGLDLVHVNPSAVYGPSPVHVSLNTFFIRLLNGKVPILPFGGMSVVYVDDVAEAHLAAAERGRTGERYLVSDGYKSNRELAEAALRAAGVNKKAPPTAPSWLIRAIAAISAPLARLFKFEPLVAPGIAAFMRWQVRIDATKAGRELGFKATPFEIGMERTIASLREQKLIRAV